MKGAAPRSTSSPSRGRSRPHSFLPMRRHHGSCPMPAVHDAADEGRHDRRLRRRRDAFARHGVHMALRGGATGASAADSSRSTRRTPTAASSPAFPRAPSKQMPPWESKIFAGTKRDWWVYVPAQYKPEIAGRRDGVSGRRRRPKDYVPIVFDNLIAKGDMPVTVGHLHSAGRCSPDGRSNRSFEYDTLSDQYARFLLEEILPEVEKTVKLGTTRRAARSRARAAAASAPSPSHGSGPNEFSKVLSWIGSFTNIASGKTRSRGRAQLRSDGPQDAEEADPRLPAGRRERSRQRATATGRWRIRRWRSRSPSPDTTTSSSTARASTATGTGGRFCPTRCAGCGADYQPDTGTH